MMNRSKLLALRLVALALLAALGAAPAAAQLQFHPLAPCRVSDTRGPTAPNGGPALANRVTRNFTVQGVCGVPAGADAVAVNVTVVQQTHSGHLTAWPAGGAVPNVSTLNFVAGAGAIANGTIVPLAAQTPDLSVRPDMGNVTGSVHLVLDVTGYFD